MMRGVSPLLLGLAMALAALSAAAAASPDSLLEHIEGVAGQVAQDPQAAVADPKNLVDSALDTGDDPSKPGPAPPGDEPDPGFADRVRDAFGGRVVVAGATSLALALTGIAGFALVTRYISPKEALRNPQRAMLYGFIRGNPGVHLKKLSEEFAMKTSSILWHVRKLESAELIHSERSNGFRVFYPVEGGIEVRRVSRAITALQNGNARALFEAIERRPGVAVGELCDRLGLHSGTARWHLRKLRDFGLIEELVRDDGSQCFPTPLGRKSLHTLMGAPVEAPAHIRSPAFPLETPQGS